MQRFSRRKLIGLLPMAVLAAGRATAQTAVTIYKDPGCGCCSNWADLLRRQGFAVTVNEFRDMGPLKQKYSVPPSLQSCHTAIVGPYAIEGHVPPTDIKRLLKDKPAVAGLAVPGMPVGSPGMEVPGATPQPYKVLAFTRDGKTQVFASY